MIHEGGSQQRRLLERRLLRRDATRLQNTHGLLRSRSLSLSLAVLVFVAYRRRRVCREQDALYLKSIVVLN